MMDETTPKFIVYGHGFLATAKTINRAHEVVNTNKGDGDIYIHIDDFRRLQAWAAAWKAAAKRYHQAAHKSICVYCGEEGPKELDWISEHIVSCEKRPEKELVQVIVNAVDTVKAFEAENARLRECIEAVEYYESYDVRCPWCGYHPYDGHRKDCQRQHALAGEG